MSLKPQDVLVVLKLLTTRPEHISYNRLALELGMSPSEVHAAGKRAIASQLATLRDGRLSPLRRNLEEFLLHGLRYAFPPVRGEMSRGMPTLSAAAPLKQLMNDSDEPPAVWPDPHGQKRGQTLEPLYRAVPVAARNDQALYELLVLTDAIRAGQARERKIAMEELRRRLSAACEHD